jgi:hypothetical protein
MAISPNPMFPETQQTMFESTYAPSMPGNRGPLRFEEGIATDTDVPYDFGVGAYEDTAPAPGRQNHNNPEMFYKYAEETMRERAHVGSATWIEAPAMLGDFVQGSMSGEGMPVWEYAYNTGGMMKRPNPTVVYD